MEIDSDNTLIKNEIKIISLDKKEFVVSSQIIKMSKFIELNYNLTHEKIEVDVPSEELEKIIKFSKYHNYIHPKEIKKPLLYNDFSKCVEDIWDSKFIMELEYDKAIDLLNASKILMIESLLDLCYAYLAYYFRTTPLNVLKHKFFLRETQFSENELDFIKKENNWLLNYGKLN